MTNFTSAFENRIKHRFAELLPNFVSSSEPASVDDPQIVVANTDLLANLGMDPAEYEEHEMADFFAGNSLQESSGLAAMAYSGHQFGQFSGVLGDGRALLYGDIETNSGESLEVHFKGTGITPFARRGDGKATIGPMLKEYIFAEAMHALGVPTNRALAVVATGENIHRQKLEPGAVLTRTASSYIRVGTFQFATTELSIDELKNLADYVIDSYYPELAKDHGGYAQLLANTIQKQACLIAKWMSVGFIHGVMNTDNMTISGESIDYGPCAFMDGFTMNQVFSSIDRQSRYCYGNQPAIGLWNLERFAETLLPLLADDVDEAIEIAKEHLGEYEAIYVDEWLKLMKNKLGLTTADEGDQILINDLLKLMQSNKADFTKTFRALANHLRSQESALNEVFEDRDDPSTKAWLDSWTTRLETEGRDKLEVADAMEAVNPIYIPRNHLVDKAMRSAEVGDYKPARKLISVLKTPFTAKGEFQHYSEPAPEDFYKGFRTFCGT